MEPSHPPFTPAADQPELAPDEPLLVPAARPPAEVDTDRDLIDSGVTLTMLSGPSLRVWSSTDTGTRRDIDAQVSFRLHPHQPVIIGRVQGPGVPYLDPAYTSTPILPWSGESILSSDGRNGRDCYVSRAHFMLTRQGAGVVFTNGVPRQGGGIRPPVNSTRLLEPEDRWLDPGERLVVPGGSAVTVRLPNDSVIRITAD